jgi:hypothetical protein
LTGRITKVFAWGDEMNNKTLTFLFLLLADQLFGGCLACWNLHRVKITLQDNRILDVFIQWNDEWAGSENYSDDKENQFPKIIFKSVQHKYITAYNYYDLKQIKYPKDGLLVSLSREIKIPISEITAISIKKGKYDGYSGAGFLSVVNNRTYKLLLTPPLSIYTTSSQVCDDYWLSYNKEFDEKYLSTNCKVPLKNQEAYFKLLERKKIIFISICYD